MRDFRRIAFGKRKGDKKMVFSIADKTKYYRQNNNEIKPGIRCKPTATGEGLDIRIVNGSVVSGSLSYFKITLIGR